MSKSTRITRALGALALFSAAAAAQAGFGAGGKASADPEEVPDHPSFVNWENPHVHPLDLTPSGDRLLAVNTADNRLEVFDLTGGSPAPEQTIPVGLDPVSVRARTDAEAWVVNHVSDSVSIVDLGTGNVVATLQTDDEPCDVVFAQSKAFVSCSQANTVLVFSATSPGAPLDRIAIQGEDPRALAVDAEGTEVYAAIFESGNRSTILGGSIDEMVIAFPPNVVSHPSGPYGGENPPPNDGPSFSPPINGGLPDPPEVSLIVKQDRTGAWMDDNDGDWTELVSGADAALSGRPVGWRLIDHDVAVIDASSHDVRYAGGAMNLCMAISVHPSDGRLAVVGTDSTNEVRFEPVLSGRFLRVNLAFVDLTRPAALSVPVDPAGLATVHVVDLNPHLTYAGSTVPQATRDMSLGDPRGIAWSPAGDRAFVTGMGSNNVVVVDAAGDRAGITPTIEVGEGPTGVVFDAGRDRVYVLNKFEASISVLDASTEAESARVPFFDPSPEPIRTGRKHLYDTHETSGSGHVSCASCHIDARTDRMAWDLGDPSGEMKDVVGQNLGAGVPGLNGGFEDFHPMKGPMMTQTLQDIIGKEPHHWRGDRDGIEEFSGAFQGLLGDDETLTSSEMQEFEDFLATIFFPPNPFREFDNRLPRDLPLPGHFTTGRFGPAGNPLPNGDALRGLQLYRPPRLLDGDALACVSCHTLPTGLGTDTRIQGGSFQPIEPGPDGEHHHALVSVDGTSNVSMKIPQMRNLHEKAGFEMTRPTSLAGFGFLHDASIDSIARFVSEPAFTVTSDQEVADLVAFMLAFSGSQLPAGSPTNVFEPPGTASQDTHAAVGVQTTLVDGASPAPGQLEQIDDMIALAASGRVGLVVKGRQAGIARGYKYHGSDFFRSDRAAEFVSKVDLIQAAAPGSELTFTVVPVGSETRIGVDRDEDGVYDRDELDHGADPADPASLPGGRKNRPGLAAGLPTGRRG